MKIEIMQDEDIEDVLDLEKRVFTSCWTRKELEFEINENEYSQLFVLKDANFLVGYAGVSILFERGEVLTLAVDPEYQGQHLGEKLLRHLIKIAIKNECEVISLEVRKSNKKAINLYEKYGFITMRVRPSYYQDNYEDAYEMAKPIGGLNEEDFCD